MESLFIERLKSFSTTLAPQGAGWKEGNKVFATLLNGSSMKSGSTSTATVYLVDDDSAAREAITSWLEPLGYHVHAIDSAEELRRVLRPCEAGCVILDERLPGERGVDVLREDWLRESGLPAIVVTAYATTALTVEAMKRGAVQVLDKPCDSEALRAAVDEAIEESRRRKAAIARERAAKERVRNLGPQEREVLQMVLDGTPNKQIARKLNVCVRTVEARRSKIFKTLEAGSIPELVRTSILAGVVDAI